MRRICIAGEQDDDGPVRLNRQLLSACALISATASIHSPMKPMSITQDNVLNFAYRIGGTGRGFEMSVGTSVDPTPANSTGGDSSWLLGIPEQAPPQPESPPRPGRVARRVSLTCLPSFTAAGSYPRTGLHVGRASYNQRDGQQPASLPVVHPVRELPGIVGQNQPVGGGTPGSAYVMSSERKSLLCV
jgi:hypothetical protein